MRTLAIECATEACSVALFDDGELLAAEHQILGRGHAEHLVPMIASLPNRGKAERILVSLGPGSFTGVRIGIAAAKALALAWRAQVLGYPTLALVAAIARKQIAGPLTVCMTGGHSEWFVQDYGANGLPETALRSMQPADAAGHRGYSTIAGSQANALAAIRGAGRALELLPDARHAPGIPAELLSDRIAPVYGRAPDARVPA